MTTLLLIAATLSTVAFAGGHLGGYYPRARQQWLIMACCLITASVWPNWWLQALMLWFVAQIVLIHQDFEYHRFTPLLTHTAALGGALTTAWVVLPTSAGSWLLWAIATLAVPFAAWALVSQYYHPDNYVLRMGWFTIFEEHAPAMTCGTGNLNHAEAVGGVLAACALGLTSQTPWAWGLVVCAVLPIVLGRWNRYWYAHKYDTNPWFHQATQGDIYLMALLPMAVVMQGWLTWWHIAAIALGWLPILGAFYYEEAKERLRMWYQFLRDVWWAKKPWFYKLAGSGPRSWGRDHKVYAEENKGLYGEGGVWTDAHNEYIQALYEWGVLGLVLVGGSLVTLIAASASHPALLNMGLMLCLIACLQCPWTIPHEMRTVTPIPVVKGPDAPQGLIIPAEGTSGIPVKEGAYMYQLAISTHGSPLLNLLSALWMLLVWLTQ